MCSRLGVSDADDKLKSVGRRHWEETMSCILASDNRSTYLERVKESEVQIVNKNWVGGEEEKGDGVGRLSSGHGNHNLKRSSNGPSIVRLNDASGVFDRDGYRQSVSCFAALKEDGRRKGELE